MDVSLNSVQHRISQPDIFNALNIQQQDKWTQLTQHLQELTQQIPYSINVYTVFAQIHHVTEQCERLLYCETHINTSDKFTPSKQCSQTSSILFTVHNDILINILQFLLCCELIQLRRVCVQLRALIFDIRVWQHGVSNVGTCRQEYCWYLRINNTNCIDVLDTVSNVLTHRWNDKRMQWWLQYRMKHITRINRIKPQIFQQSYIPQYFINVRTVSLTSYFPSYFNAILMSSTQLRNWCNQLTELYLIISICGGYQYARHIYDSDDLHTLRALESVKHINVFVVDLKRCINVLESQVIELCQFITEIQQLRNVHIVGIGCAQNKTSFDHSILKLKHYTVMDVKYH